MMQFNQFPYSFLQELDRVTNQKINQVTQQKNEAINRLNSNNNNTVHSLSSSKNTSEPKYGQFAGGGFITGLIVGGFICVAGFDALFGGINLYNAMGSSIVFWIRCGIIGTVLGLVLCASLANAQKKSNESIDNQISLESTIQNKKSKMKPKNIMKIFSVSKLMQMLNTKHT